ncbi:MAG: bifunctional phosphopantothenoylcysteine decarboxylase/phosphopantothenate--cysteine ligase CoaBC [Saprospiraceae bacterium]
MSKYIIGISGSIAAYKSAYLVRALIKKKHAIKVVMTPSATKFIAPITLSTLSKNEVSVELINEGTWNNHVELGIWADGMIVAPATATTLGKMAHGIADNMLIATYLSSKCPVYIAPAMDLDMWKHPSTKANISILKSYGNHIINVNNGELASGLYGEGRMAEPDDIVTFLENLKLTENKLQLKGKKVIITAGPTHEKIDAVRFISNRSTGKMGIALADACFKQGAEVILILGPSKHRPIHREVKVILITSAEEMYNATIKQYHNCDIAIMAAAVADYTPTKTYSHKVKKGNNNWEMDLKRTKDIAAQLGKMKQKSQINIGFALETDNEMEYAQNKLKKKSFDFIVLNSLQDKGAGFGHDTNKVTIIHKDNKIKKYELKSKPEVAHDIINEIVTILPHA